MQWDVATQFERDFKKYFTLLWRLERRNVGTNPIPLVGVKPTVLENDCQQCSQEYPPSMPHVKA